MFRSIVTKLWAFVFFLVFGVIIFFTFILSNRIDQINLAHEIELMREIEGQWAKELTVNKPLEQLQQEAEFWGHLSRYTITVLDKHGIIRLSSDREHARPGQKFNWTHKEKTVVDNRPVYTGYSPDLKMEMTATLKQVTMKSGETLTLMIHASNHELMEINRAIKKTTATQGLIFLAIGAPLVFFLSRWLAKPLVTIRKAAMGMARGNFDTRVELRRNDELGDLAGTINNLAARLKTSIHSLYNTNRELNDILSKWKDFLADVSHELRTPLFLISGYTEAILDGVVEDRKAREEYLPVIHKEALRLHKLVDDLTKAEQITKLDRHKVVLSEMVAETIKPFEILLQERKITLAIDKEIAGLPPVSLDSDRFGEVIFNLVDNAIRHSPVGGKINISAHINNETNNLVLEISDTGSGIPAEHLPRLFERFYRVDKARSRARGGTGLGLSIVKKIVDLHEGKIEVSSKVGRGTKFIICLPLHKENDR